MCKTEKNRTYLKTVYVLITILIVVFVSCVASACTSSSTKKTTVVAHATPSALATPTIQPIPTDAIPVDNQWREVLHLGMENNVLVTQGEFISSRSYRVLAVCEGKGSIKVDLSPQGSALFQCTSTPVLQGDDYETPLKQEQITVVVTPPVVVAPQGKVLWEVSVQLAAG